MATRGRPRKNPLPTLIPAPAPISAEPVEAYIPQRTEYAEVETPPDWRKGQLLNVRNTGPDYTITLWPEEADPRKPERALHFTNVGECQNFVSKWYDRQSYDPRAR